MRSRHLVTVIAGALLAGGCFSESLIDPGPSGNKEIDDFSENLLVAAVGLDVQPTRLDFRVPAASGADITGARLRWTGRSASPAGDASLLVNGHQRTGTLVAMEEIGGPLPWLFVYEYDASSLVRHGNNTLWVSGFQLGDPMRADGLVAIVTYVDETSPWTAIHLVDPVEFVSGGPGEVWEFPIGRSSPARNGRLVLAVAGGDATGSDDVWWSAGPGAVPEILAGTDANVFTDRLIAGSGNWMDVLDEEVAVPGGAAHLAYQLDSPATGGDALVHLFGALCIDGQPSTCAASVRGRVWRDLDADGVAEADEPGIPEIPVTLLTDLEEVVAETLTDAFGTFEFSELCAGEYQVAMDEAALPDGLESTTGGDGDCCRAPVTVASDGAVVDGIVFGWIEALPENACFYDAAYWRFQYGTLVGDGSRCDPFDPDLLWALLAIVEATTDLDWSGGDGSLDPEDAVRVLGSCGESTCGDAERHYFAVLLNYAFNGAHLRLPVDTDGDELLDATMGDVIELLETALEIADEDSCAPARELAEAVNETPSSGDCPY
jgi:hypothetical protein